MSNIQFVKSGWRRPAAFRAIAAKRGAKRLTLIMADGKEIMFKNVPRNAILPVSFDAVVKGQKYTTARKSLVGL